MEWRISTFKWCAAFDQAPKKKRKKDVDSKNDRGGGGKKKNLDKCHFQKLDFEKKTLRSMRSCLSRERERDLFRTTAKLLSKVFFNEQNSIDEPIHRNLCRALIEPNK